MAHKMSIVSHVNKAICSRRELWAPLEFAIVLLNSTLFVVASAVVADATAAAAGVVVSAAPVKLDKLELSMLNGDDDDAAAAGGCVIFIKSEPPTQCIMLADNEIELTSANRSASPTEMLTRFV